MCEQSATRLSLKLQEDALIQGWHVLWHLDNYKLKLFLWLRLEEAQVKRGSGGIIRKEGGNLCHGAAIRHCDGLWTELDSRVRAEQSAQAERNCSPLLAQGLSGGYRSAQNLGLVV